MKKIWNAKEHLKKQKPHTETEKQTKSQPTKNQTPNKLH